LAVVNELISQIAVLAPEDKGEQPAPPKPEPIEAAGEMAGVKNELAN
jgi:hypothetical protein